VTADEDARVKRLVESRKMIEDEARSRIASQVPDPKRLEMADIVIENNGTLEDLHLRVQELWQEIARRAATAYS